MRSGRDEERPVRAFYLSVTGFALLLVVLAFPWSSGTGGTSFRGWVWVRSGRAIPCFGIKLTSRAVFPPVCDLFRSGVRYRLRRRLRVGERLTQFLFTVDKRR